MLLYTSLHLPNHYSYSYSYQHIKYVALLYGKLNHQQYISQNYLGQPQH